MATRIAKQMGVICVRVIWCEVLVVVSVLGVGVIRWGGFGWCREECSGDVFEQKTNTYL